MKIVDKRVLVAVAALMALAALFWVLSFDAGSEVDETFRIERVADLQRVEIMAPTGADRPELVALERRDDTWWIVGPVEARLDDDVARQFSEVFERSIGTDDIELDVQRAHSYGLDDDHSVRVALFGAGDERPAREFLVGEQMHVDQTGARRTFLKEPGGSTIYRAQAGFGQLVRRPLAELRDNAITDVGQEGIDAIDFQHADGHRTAIDYVDGTWQFGDIVDLDEAVDEQVSTRLAATVGRLRATGFPERDADDVGVDNPQVVVTIDTGDGEIVLDVGHHNGRYIVRRADDDTLYTVDHTAGRLLQSTTGDLRERRVVGADRTIDAMELVDGTPLSRDDGRWHIVDAGSGDADGDIDNDAVQRIADRISGLRVERWIDDLDDLDGDTGLDDGPTIGFDIDGQRQEITVGVPLDDRSAAHYGAHSEQDGVFVLSRSAVRELRTTRDRISP